MSRYDLSDEEWSIIQPLLPKQWRGPKRRDDRQVLNGIFFVLRSGIQWEDLPERYGPAKTVYNRYNRWGQRGVWKDVFDALVRHSENSLVFIDSTIVKAHRCASGGKKGSWSKVLAVRVADEQRRYMSLSTNMVGQ